MHTIEDIVNYVEKNRNNGYAFKFWPKEAIAIHSYIAIISGELLYGINENDEIDGVLLLRVNGEDMRVVNVLTTRKKVGQQLMSLAFERFPQCKKVHFQRRDRERILDINSGLKRHMKNLNMHN